MLIVPQFIDLTTYVNNIGMVQIISTAKLD